MWIYGSGRGGGESSCSALLLLSMIASEVRAESNPAAKLEEPFGVGM